MSSRDQFGVGSICQGVDEDARAAVGGTHEGEARAVGRRARVTRVVQQGLAGLSVRVDLLYAAAVLGLCLAGHRDGRLQVGALVQDAAAVWPECGQIERLGLRLPRQQRARRGGLEVEQHQVTTQRAGGSRQAADDAGYRERYAWGAGHIGRVRRLNQLGQRSGPRGDEIQPGNLAARRAEHLA